MMSTNYIKGSEYILGWAYYIHPWMSLGLVYLDA